MSLHFSSSMQHLLNTLSDRDKASSEENKRFEHLCSSFQKAHFKARGCSLIPFFDKQNARIRVEILMRNTSDALIFYELFTIQTKYQMHKLLSFFLHMETVLQDDIADSCTSNSCFSPKSIPPITAKQLRFFQKVEKYLAQWCYMLRIAFPTSCFKFHSPKYLGSPAKIFRIVFFGRDLPFKYPYYKQSFCFTTYKDLKRADVNIRALCIRQKLSFTMRKCGFIPRMLHPAAGIFQRKCK